MLCFTVALAGLLIFRGAAPADDVPTSLNAGGGGSPPHLTPVQDRPKDAVLDEFLDIARLLEERGARLIGGSRTPKLRRELAEAPPRSSQAIELRVRLGVELLRLGESAAALTELQEALRIADDQSILRQP